MAGIGEALRSTRERRGLSIDQVAQDTRISPRFLEALEAEQFHELPAPVYVRGFLRSYANYLRIDPQPLLDQLIGGDMAAPGAADGYVGANGRARANGTASPRRNDPFQRSGVVPVASRGGRSVPATARKPEPADEWAPEPLAPFTPPHEDHGYIPGSDLLEAPEYPIAAEEEPVFARRRTAGVLAERPPLPGEPGVSRRVLVFGGAVVAIVAFMALAVLATRGGGNGNTSADARGDEGPGATPGTVISLGGASGTATAAAATASKTTAAATASVTSSATPDGTATPGATQTVAPAGGTVTGGGATPTPSPSSAAPTQAPAATPTPVPPTPTPTVYAPPPHPSTISACDLSRETEKCGSANVRVICFPPFAETDPTGRNNNYFVDVTGTYPLQPGWRETIVFAPVSIGPVIDAGRSGC